MHNTKQPRDRGPGVTFPPPLIYAIALSFGSTMQRMIPLPVAIHGERNAATVGIGVIVVGVAVALAGALTFRRFGTPVHPTKPAARIVDAGIYSYTRNPMYSGLTIAYIGFALWIATWWMLALLPIVLTIIITKVIRREERYLTAAFPQEYADYCSRVRRWI